MLSPNLARIRSFDVVPSLPEPLDPLLELAHNLWWSWQPTAVQLFKRIDPELWRRSGHNPVQMLGSCPQNRLEQIATDDGFLTSMHRIAENLKIHVERTTWLASLHDNPGPCTIAYFCAEFGLTECLQIYSGGLGCLAGDHLKSASELGLPLVGIGLLYRHGYFQQYLNADGWQQEYYPDLDCANLPIKPVRDDDGRQIKVTIELPDREVHVAIWKVRVGRIDLYLLDTNVPENGEEDRNITAHLYGGDMEMRIKQEIVLGVGGVRALAACGIHPDICHMNEGYSAFLALERTRMLIEKHDLSFDEARQQAAASHIFTTHTPVPAGIDRFPPELVEQYLGHYQESLRLDIEGLLALGRENVSAKNEFFSMAVLAIRMSDWSNGVSALHGQVSRNMWQNIWPGIPEPEIPISHVTNGVHARSWMSGELINLIDGYLGARWQHQPADESAWATVHEVPDEEMWRIHEQNRRRLIIWTRRQLRQHMEARGNNPDQLATAEDALDPNALTIGFARRFATYKRGDLLLADADRLCALLNNKRRPVQLLIAGKAHPADSSGKDIIRHIVQFAQEHDMMRHIVFIENYNINVARYLVQGCDVWLNTPRRGMEASGTSGMKAALNGVLNCSVLDGWWDEAYASELGWAVGRGESYADVKSQDAIESNALYDLIEKQIIPLFYQRDEQGIPRQWVGRMKKCIATLAPEFNTNRMVRQYTEKFYLPALRRSRMLGEDNLSKSIELAHQKDRLRSAWNRISVEHVDAYTSRPLRVGDELNLTVTVSLADIGPEELRVQIYAGDLDNDGHIRNGQATDLAHHQDLGAGRHQFRGIINTDRSGRHGYAVRIIPGGPIFQDITEPGLIHWDSLSPSVAAAGHSAHMVAARSV